MLKGSSFGCDNIVELLSAYLDGRVSEQERQNLEEHLAGCPRCTDELEAMRLTIQALRELPFVPAPRSFALSAKPRRAPSILPYLRNATVALAAVFVTMFATSLYLQKSDYGMTSVPPKPQLSVAAPAQERALSNAPEAAALPKESKREAEQKPSPPIQQRAPAAAPAAPAPSQARSQLDVETSKGEAGSSLSPKRSDDGSKQAAPAGVEESMAASAPAIGKEEPTKAQGGVGRGKLVDGAPPEELEWPFLEAEVGVFVLLLLVGVATLIVLRKERSNP